MKQFTLHGLILLLIIAGGNACAETIADIYQIEVIVFEHTDPNRFKAEHWPKFAGKLDLNRAINLNDLKNNIPESLDTLQELDALDEVGNKPLKKVVKDTVTLVEPKNYLLNQEDHMIKMSKVERYIKHIAWNQPLAPNVRSTPVYFVAGKDQEITTMITIKPSRNIFTVNIDAIYKSEAVEIRLTRDVKVKKKEVYYVDHPVIGIMLIISPVIQANWESNTNI